MSIYRPEQDSPRFVPVDKIHVSIYDRKLGQTYGEVSDISSLGASIAADREYEPDSTVLLRLSLHDQPDVFTTRAEVVWCRAADKDSGHPYTYVVKFCVTEEEQRQSLESLLNGSQLKPASHASGDGEEAEEIVIELEEDRDLLG